MASSFTYVTETFEGSGLMARDMSVILVPLAVDEIEGMANIIGKLLEHNQEKFKHQAEFVALERLHNRMRATIDSVLEGPDVVVTVRRAA